MRRCSRNFGGRGAPWLRRPVLLAVAAGGIWGCGAAKEKAKDELENQTGIKQLSPDDVVGQTDKWDTDRLEIATAFEIGDGFDGDLTKKTEMNLAWLPDATRSKLAGQFSALLKIKEFTVKAGTKSETLKRFEIVNLAKFNSDTDKLEILGEKFAEYVGGGNALRLLGADQKGQYMLVHGKQKALACVTGSVLLKKPDATTAAVSGARMFTTSSPFITDSGDGGKYFLALYLEGNGDIVAFKSDYPSASGFDGTPQTANRAIPYAGALPQALMDALNEKGQLAGAGADLGDQINAALKTDDFAVIKGMDVVFEVPPQPTADEPPPAPPVAEDPPAPPPTPEPPPADPQPGDEIPPPADNPGDLPQEEPQPNEPEPPVDRPDGADMGCSGTVFDGDGKPQSSLVTDVEQFEAYDKVAGWRFKGDALISDEAYGLIWPEIPATVESYRDNPAYKGYCVVTSGNAQYNKLKNANPGQEVPNFMPFGGQSSQMWQKVRIPAEAKTIQMRVAFLTQEYPYWVGSQYNDSFFVKFDESPDFLAQGTLNALAGGISGCSPSDMTTEAGSKCGEWQSTNSGFSGAPAQIWDIDQSTDAVSQGSSYKCGDGKCYHGMIKPRVICAAIPEMFKGEEVTLRLAVSDAGDAIYDSALAVDSIVVSTEACPATAADTFTKEEKSKVSQ